MKEFSLMLHPTFGVLAALAAVWVFVDALNAGTAPAARIRAAALAATVFLWLSFLFGGYWYVQYYAADKAIIKAGPWPLAHNFFMETKEHLFFTLLLLGTYLPISVQNNLAADRGTHLLVLTVTALVVLLGLAMEGRRRPHRAGRQNGPAREVIMENTSLNRTAVGFGYSFAVVNLLSAVLVVKERYEPLMAWMKALTGHHWTTHALFAVVGFVALGLALSYAREWKATARTVISAVVFSTVAGGLIIAGFYLFE